MADKRIKDLDTEVTIANDADYIPVDGTGGTDASKKISVLNFQAQMRNNLTDTEMSILDGATVTTAELNILDGVTATTAELNILDGVTATAEELNIIDGVTATTEEINILDGVTATTAELNIMDGVTATTSELNSLDGFTGDYEDLNYAKELKDTGVTSTEYGKLDGVTTPLSGLNQALEANEVTITAKSYDAREAGVYYCNTASNAINVTIPITTQLNSGAPMLFINTAGTNNLIISCNALDEFTLMTGSGTQTTGTTLTLSAQSSCVYFIPCDSQKYLIILGGYGVTIS
jgi:hypothetical protein